MNTELNILVNLLETLPGTLTWAGSLALFNSEVKITRSDCGSPPPSMPHNPTIGNRSCKNFI